MTWSVSLIIVMTALGALMSTTIRIDRRRILTMRYHILGIPFSTMRFDPEFTRLRQVELRVAYRSMPGLGGAHGRDSSSPSRTLRLYLELRSDQGLNLVKADSITLSPRGTSPDSASEVMGLIRGKGKQAFLLQGKLLADALELPLVCSGDWGRDRDRQLVYAASANTLKATALEPRAAGA